MYGCVPDVRQRYEPAHPEANSCQQSVRLQACQQLEGALFESSLTTALGLTRVPTIVREWNNSESGGGYVYLSDIPILLLLVIKTI